MKNEKLAAVIIPTFALLAMFTGCELIAASKPLLGLCWLVLGSLAALAAIFDAGAAARSSSQSQEVL